MLDESKNRSISVTKSRWHCCHGEPSQAKPNPTTAAVDKRTTLLLSFSAETVIYTEANDAVDAVGSNSDAAAIAHDSENSMPPWPSPAANAIPHIRIAL